MSNNHLDDRSSKHTHMGQTEDLPDGGQQMACTACGKPMMFQDSTGPRKPVATEQDPAPASAPTPVAVPRAPQIRRLDLASLALLLVGLVFGAISYWLITYRGANALLIVPSIVAATTGASHITKKHAPRDRRVEPGSVSQRAST